MNRLVPVLALAALAAPCATALAQEKPPLTHASEPEELALTVYSTADPAGFDPQQFVAQQRMGHNPMFAWQVPGYGVVKEVRKVLLAEGITNVRMTDVAAHIDPTTVSFADLDAPGTTSVSDQSFLFDLVSPQKLLERYVDREVSFREYPATDTAPEKWVKGRVLSVSGGQVVLQGHDGGLRFVRSTSEDLRLPSLPDGLITRPTLQWRIANAGAAGEHRVRSTYQTRGLTWRADYNVVLNAKDTKADVGAWVTLMNLSGASYPNAKLKLVAGDVQRIQRNMPQPARMMRARGGRDGAAEAGFEEKSFFEYHLYTLPRKTDVPVNSTQQIALFPTASGVDVQKVMVYYGLPAARHWGYGGSAHVDRNFGNQSNPKVDVYVQFENKEANRLGRPLPKGKIRAYKRDDADGTLEFIGEDLIDHTPRDETVRIRLGQAFDVVGERTQTNFRVDTSRKWLTEDFRIQIRNHKDEPVTVIVKENLYRWSNWEIRNASDPHKKVDSRTIHFTVTVPPRGQKTVTYQAHYTW